MRDTFHGWQAAEGLYLNGGGESRHSRWPCTIQIAEILPGRRMTLPERAAAQIPMTPASVITAVTKRIR